MPNLRPRGRRCPAGSGAKPSGVVRRRNGLGVGQALAGLLAAVGLFGVTAPAANVYLLDVPDYQWYAGCFGTACGNLMGFWDRNGLPEFYTGPTNEGLAPLDDRQDLGHRGIRSLWATKAGFDGRPADQPGHIDDYWAWYDSDNTYSYESTAPDAYLLAGRPEHEPDCIGDFIGLSQNRWTNLNGECDGNIDAYSFVYWDATGERRVNFVPGPEAGLPARDIPSGLRAWTRWRGYDCEVFSQLTDFNPEVPAGKGFTFEDMKAEIDAGYPVLLFLQPWGAKSRNLPGMPRANPSIHGMLAYGYYVTDTGQRFVRFRDSWGGGNLRLHEWNAESWVFTGLPLPVRGVIGYHPFPKITQVQLEGDRLRIRWDGPAARLFDVETGTERPAHFYMVEMAESLSATEYVPVLAEPTPAREALLQAPASTAVFFRVRLVQP